MICYEDHPLICVPTMPGRHRSRQGFIYSILCDGYVFKIGASANPKARIGEQCRRGSLDLWNLSRCRFQRFGVEKIIISEKSPKFRVAEKRLNFALRPFRFGRMREWYLAPEEIRGAVEVIFADDFSDSAFATLTETVRAEVNSWREASK